MDYCRIYFSGVNSVCCIVLFALLGGGALAQEEKFRASTEPTTAVAQGHGEVRAVLIGEFTDPSARELWEVLVSRLPDSADREWFTSAEDASRSSLGGYPKLAKPAAFLCINGRCSVALFTQQELARRIDDMLFNKR